MWRVLFIILSILGIILLCLLGFVLLVLFMPVVYRGGGKAHAGEYEAWFRFRWFFGLVRGRFTYPDTKALKVKVLWLTVYDSNGKKKKQKEAEDASKNTAEAIVSHEEEEQIESESEKVQREQPEQETVEQEAAKRETVEQEAVEHKEPLLKKLAGFKEKIQPYLDIVQDQENQELLKHALNRLGKLLKSIRPRVMHAEAVVGLGEPDTTGYVYGAYWTIKPFLGRRCRVTVTPDFEQQILEGKVMVRGYIFAAVLLYQVIRVILDRRLRRLICQLNRTK